MIYKVCTSPSMFGVVNWRRLRWAGYATGMKDTRNTCILWRESSWKQGRFEDREGNAKTAFKMVVRDAGCESVRSIVVYVHKICPNYRMLINSPPRTAADFHYFPAK